MKKINKRFLFSSLLTFLLSIALVYILMFVDNNIRYVVSLLLTLTTGVISLAFIKIPDSDIYGSLDERDQVNEEKSSLSALKLLNYVLIAVVYVTISLYGITKSNFYLVIVLTELVTIILSLIVWLAYIRFNEKIN